MVPPEFVHALGWDGNTAKVPPTVCPTPPSLPPIPVPKKAALCAELPEEIPMGPDDGNSSKAQLVDSYGRRP